MKFQKEFLVEMVYESTMNLEAGDYGFEVPTIVKSVEKEIVDTSRWSTFYDQVFSVTQDGVTKFYRTGWSEGSTECQDESPYEYEPDEIDCPEVFPVEKTVIVYE
ncbi:hypothetical protein ZPAH1_orf00089 [Aeromonas phage ZPAH1]|nr:hypothetical protein ZPAH1_orf00089 [Aeromonas phage ZPAH1]